MFKRDKDNEDVQCQISSLNRTDKILFLHSRQLFGILLVGTCGETCDFFCPAQYDSEVKAENKKHLN